MATLSYLVLLLVSVGAYSASQPDRIVGGTETSIEQYPGMVQVDFLGLLTNLWGQSCAANVLTTRYMLTAAHCFDGIFYNIERRRIRAGTTYRNTGGSLHSVEVVFNHPSYGQNRYDGDISVIRILQPLVYGTTIQPSTIVSQGAVIPDNLPVVHAGWGTTSFGGSPSSVLLETTIYTVNNDLCRERYLVAPNPGVVTENMICAGLLDVGGKDACQGDSGGPLYYDNIVIGIVSWGHQCANDTWPGVSASVASYTDWIISVAV